MRHETYAILARTVPFVLYMAFVALLELPTLFGLPALGQDFTIISYPIKITLVVAALFLFKKAYTDLDWTGLRNIRQTLLSVVVGIAVFLVWINLVYPWAIQGELTSYDPTLTHQGLFLYILIACRVVGAAVVVPIMEELFWRSFLSRYLAGKDFMRVRPGTFTLFSFVATSVLFGIEHQLYLAGIVAGVAYNYLYWQTRSLSQCVISHAVTNALLAAYVLTTRSWLFW